MLIELDEVMEARISKEAEQRGMRPEALVTQWLESSLHDRDDTQTPSAQQVAERRTAIEKMLQESKDRTLGLKELGLTMREFMHQGHRY